MNFVLYKKKTQNESTQRLARGGKQTAEGLCGRGPVQRPGRQGRQSAVPAVQRRLPDVQAAGRPQLPAPVGLR